MGTYKEIVEIDSMLEIPQAYVKAIEQLAENQEYRDKENYGGDVWDAKIELKQINFESNFRRVNLECEFEITTGSFLNRYKENTTSETNNADL